MIKNRFTDEEIPIDILRVIVNRSSILPLIALINGHGQIGKSTFLFHLANRIMQIKKYGRDWKKHKNEWLLWDYKLLCTRSAEEFINAYEKYDNIIIALEEAGEQLEITEYFSTMNKVFSMIARTQGYKRNICLIITPYANDLLKIHKRKIDFILWVRRKHEETRTCEVVPRIVQINYLSLKEDNWKLRYCKSWTIQFTIEELKLANDYTDWLKGFKSEILQRAKFKIERKSEEEWVKKFL